MNQSEVQRLIELVRAAARGVPGTDPDAPVRVEFVDELDKAAAAFSGGVIKVKKNSGIEGDKLTRLILHEITHQIVTDPSEKGHNQTWGNLFAATAIPEVGEELVSSYLSQYDEFSAVDIPTAISARHSTGGSIEMASPETVRAVESALGRTLEPEEVQYLERAVEASNGQTSPALISMLVDDFRSDAPLGTTDDADRKYLAQGADRDQAARRSAAVDDLLDGDDRVSPENQAVLEETPENQLDALIAARNAEGENPHSWIYNDLQVMPGALDKPGAIREIYERLIEFGAMEEQDPNLSEEELITTVNQFLAANPGNAIVRYAVQDWGMETNNYIPQRRVDGVLETDILAMMDQGISYGRATTIGKVAGQFDLPPSVLADLHEGQEQGWFGGSMAGLERDLQEGKSPIGRLSRKPLFETAASYKHALGIYDGSQVLATIHVSDPELAEKLNSDPWSLDSGELSRVVDMLGGQEKATERANDPQVAWLLNRAAGAYNASQLATLDKTSVEESVRALAANWNMVGFEDVAESVARKMMGSAVAEARARISTPFGGVKDPVVSMTTAEDAVAHARDQFRQTDEYGELFGHLSAGESEEEYVSRFESRGQQILGDDNVAVVRNAMRTGNVNTVYQQALNTGAGDASTRFQEILARNAQVFREML